MRIRIDQQLCTSSGQCVVTSSELFDQREEDGVAIVRIEKPPRELEEAARQAMFLCPAGAITILEDD